MTAGGLRDVFARGSKSGRRHCGPDPQSPLRQVAHCTMMPTSRRTAKA